MENSNELIAFETSPIRKVWYNNQWYFVLDDFLVYLTDTKNPKAYWSNMRRKDEALKKGYSKIYSTLSIETKGGKQKMNCADTEGVLRIVMSITSPKAEPLKLWLAQVGKERIEETENPELGFERVKELYRAKGYTDEWIEGRWKTITTRKALTKEWQNRGIKEDKEYGILTATIAKHTFGLTPSEHGKLKGLDKQNLRDHMTPLELIFSALSEEVTRQMTINDDSQGFHQNYESAVRGGNTANEARERVEAQLKKPVVSPENFLHMKGDEKNKELDVDNKEEESREKI